MENFAKRKKANGQTMIYNNKKLHRKLKTRGELMCSLRLVPAPVATFVLLLNDTKIIRYGNYSSHVLNVMLDYHLHALVI
jgi:hypothetical protein